MKSYMMYVCDTCQRESVSYDIIFKCEAEHLNLTAELYKEYLDLKKQAEHLSVGLSSKSNKETRQEYNQVIDKLVAFEEKYELI